MNIISFKFQEDFYRTFEALQSKKVLPIMVGGTGLYLDSIIHSYEMVEAPNNPTLREKLDLMTTKELQQELVKLKPQLHNTTDFKDNDRIKRAIEIELYSQDHPPKPTPEINPLILGIKYDPDILRQRIETRLKQRFDEGMIEEVRQLNSDGISWERLELLGLEYRYIAQFLQGTIPNEEVLFQTLFRAIGKFAKRQRTWFRNMEKRGSKIHWLEQGDISRAKELVQKTFCLKQGIDPKIIFEIKFLILQDW